MKKKELIKKSEIELKDDLGGPVGDQTDPTMRPIDYKAEIEKIPEDQRIQVVEMPNPATGQMMKYTIDRNGFTNEKLAAVLLNEKSTDEQKVSAISMRIWEMGKESTSYILDLMNSKGVMMKETRQFKSEMRFDFSMFVSGFCNFLFDSAQSIFNIYNIDIKEKDLEKEAAEYLKNLKVEKEIVYLSDFIKYKYPDTIENTNKLIHLDSALRSLSQARALKRSIDDITEQRENERGKGINLTLDGKIST